MDKFVSLHNHSEYSTLDGFSQIDKIIRRVKNIGQSAVAITDHGSLNGCYKFYEACKKAQIKPILGIEAYIVDTYGHQNKPNHITLLASNNKGWENLLKLHKISYQNFYYKPRINYVDLFRLKEGIICLSGCPSGIISRFIRDKNFALAKDALSIFVQEFKENFYIEIMYHKLDFEEEINQNLRNLAKRYKVKTVVTNDSHYTVKDHALYQDYLLCDQLKQNIQDERNLKLDTDEFYIKTREEMPGTEEEKDTTLEIAEKCNVEIKFNGWLLPEIEDQEAKLINYITAGIEKFGLKNNEVYLSRLREEYQIIKKANLIGYLLTVLDYIQWAKNNDILVGPGRGSIGGCLIAYLIGIHNVDPIKHKLLFSRFYNAGRQASMPDIDIDFPRKQIDRIREYIVQKYGEERIAHIGTFTYLHPKSALKLICRVLGVDFTTANYFSSVIEDEKQTEELLTSSYQFKDIVTKSREFEGLAIHSSIHAAGMLISPVDLEQLVPLRINKDNNIYVSCWDMKDVEKIGLIKYDFLSLNTLDVIGDTLRKIGLDINRIPFDDQETFNTISTTNNVGIFQLSSDGISNLANQMKVNSIDDIAIVVALYRPGPINSGLHTKYINRRMGLEPVQYAHPLLGEVLKETYGIWVYQEQIIKAAMVLANFSEVEADNLRKAISKKVLELMPEQEKKFSEGCQKNNINPVLIESMWKEIQEFSWYSFNKSHSVEYGYITYYTAYLKTHYPVEFMAALLENNFDHQTRLAIYLRECRRLNIEVIPPSVISGAHNFKADPTNKKIIFGLSGIKGIGEKTAKQIYEQQYTGFEDFCIKFRPSSDTLVALAEAGAFDEFLYKRNQIIQASTTITNKLKSQKKTLNTKARTLFKTETHFDIPNIEELSSEILAGKEYDRLNTYLVYDPLKDVQLVTPEDLTDGLIRIDGYLINIKEHLTKKQEIMAFLSVATQLGHIEALLWAKQYREKKPILQKNTYISMEGVYTEGKLLINKIWAKYD